MTTRTTSAQTLHDKVIAQRETAWRNDSRVDTLYTNPGQTKGAHYTVKGRKVYPDLIVHLTDKNQWVIEEVETADSVNESELQQWKTYAQIDASGFNLIVPTEAAEKARSLVRNLKTVAIKTYSVRGNKIEFHKN